MTGRLARAVPRLLGPALSIVLLLLLLTPVLALMLSTSAAGLVSGVRDPLFGPALLLSLRTTVISLLLLLLTGTPLAFWLATSRSRLARILELAVNLPIVIPPAVIGVALLMTFGQRGLLARQLEMLALSVSFTTAAVVIAQVVVAAPFYVQAAANAFRLVNVDLLIVARTLGASGAGAFLRVAVPIALPGLISGAALAWARALGEFGATLLFAGNLAGRTQTLPLAIYTALESDLSTAVAISLVLTAVAIVLLLALRALPHLIRRRAQTPLREGPAP